MRHPHFLVYSLAVATFVAAALADDVAPPDDISLIREANDVSQESPEFALLPAETQYLLQLHPDARATIQAGRVMAIFGAPMTSAATAAAAEESFWQTHVGAFGITDLDLQTTNVRHAAHGKFTVYAYRQRIGGFPVEYATARLVVRHGPTSDVILVSGKFVPSDADAILPDSLISADQAIESVAVTDNFSYMRNWTTPELVVFAGSEQEWTDALGLPFEAALAWKFSADSTTESGFEAVGFFVRASTGELLHTRSEVHFTDISGHVSGFALPAPPNGAAAYAAGAPLAEMDMSHLKVSVAGANPPEFAFSDVDGDFLITHSGTAAVTLTSDVIDGAYASVLTLTGPDPRITASVGVTPPGPATLRFNDAVVGEPERELRTAQVNGFLYANRARHFLIDRSGWTGLDWPLEIRVNEDGGCDANFYNGRLTFTRKENLCNMAFSSVIAHEYGHFAVNQLGLHQHSFGEGFGDALAITLFDDPVFARNYAGSGTNLRDYSSSQTESTYPCTSDNRYVCGEILAGFWRDIREQLSQAFYPGAPLTDAVAFSFTRDLFADWAMITNGGYGHNAAMPFTVAEVFTVAEPLATEYSQSYAPIRTAICAAAHQHSLAVPQPNGTCRLGVYSAPPHVISFKMPLIHFSLAGTCAAGCENPFGLAVGHINPGTDSHLDIVLTCEDSNKIIIYQGATTTPTYTVSCPPTAYLLDGTAAKPAKVALVHASLTSAPPDATLDIVATLQGDPATSKSGGVQILINDGTGIFDPTNPNLSRFIPFTDINGVELTGYCRRPLGLASADWNGDGRADIAVAGWRSVSGFDRPTLVVLWSDAAGQYSQTATVLADPTDIGRGYDLTRWTQGGSSNFLAMADETVDSDRRTYIFRHTAPQSFPLLSSVASVASRAVIQTDIDRDGLTDLAVGNIAPVQLRWIRQTVTDSFALDQTAYDNGLLFTDFNGISAGTLSRSATNPTVVDLWPDIVIAGAFEEIASRYFGVYVNTAVAAPRFVLTFFALSPNPTHRPYARQCQIIDMNADGFADVVTANRGNDAGVQGGFSVIPSRGN